MKNDSDYIVYTDGGARGNPGDAAYGFIIYDKDLNEIYKEGKRIGIATNNVAEYQGVICALKWLVQNNKISSPKIQFFLDSTLVASQMRGIFKVKNPGLKDLIITAKQLEAKLSGNVVFSTIRRENNKEADKLVNLALDFKI